MRAKEYLLGLRLLDLKIKQKQKEADEIRAASVSIGSNDYSKDKIQGNSTEAGFVRLVEKLQVLETEIKQELCQFMEKKHQIINEIQQIDNSVYMEILYKKYVLFMDLWEISQDMNYIDGYVRRMHGYALQVFEKRVLQQSNKK